MNASLHGLTAVGVFLLAGCASAEPGGHEGPVGRATATPGGHEGPTGRSAGGATAPGGHEGPVGRAGAELNDVCPITGDTSDPKFTAEYGGRRIAFCCENCLREFRGSDEAGKAAIAAKAAR